MNSSSRLAGLFSRSPCPKRSPACSGDGLKTLAQSLPSYILHKPAHEHYGKSCADPHSYSFPSKCTPGEAHHAGHPCAFPGSSRLHGSLLMMSPLSKSLMQMAQLAPGSWQPFVEHLRGNLAHGIAEICPGEAALGLRSSSSAVSGGKSNQKTTSVMLARTAVMSMTAIISILMPGHMGQPLPLSHQT